MKTLIKEIKPYVELYRDDKSGIAWVQDGSTGMAHSCHSNISASGSVRGMKDLGYWGKKDRTVRSHGYIYNIDILIVSDELDEVALNACQCASCMERRARHFSNVKKGDVVVIRDNEEPYTKFRRVTIERVKTDKKNVSSLNPEGITYYGLDHDDAKWCDEHQLIDGTVTIDNFIRVE